MLARILIFLLILLILPIYCIDRMALKHRWRGVWRLLYYLPNIILIVTLVALSIGESYSSEAAQIKSLAICATMTLAIPETLVAILMGICVLIGKKWPAVRRIGFPCSAFIGGVIGIMLLYGFTLGYRNIEQTDFTYQSRKIPYSFDGYRIVQISDFHIGTISSHGDVIEDIVNTINAAQPDLVLFTGDLVNYDAREILPHQNTLKKIQAKDGIFSVMGNHDYAQYFRWPSAADSVANIHLLQDLQKSMGWQLLLNEHAFVKRGNDSIAIIGVENCGRPPFPNLADLDGAMCGLPEGVLKILLSHDPTHWRDEVLPQSNIDLTLSGHTHGMQFRIGNFSPAAWIYDEWGGAYFEGERALYVNQGIGSVMIPFRLGAWPEITVITLRTAENGKKQN